MRVKYLLILSVLIGVSAFAKEPVNRNSSALSEERFKSMYSASGIQEHVIWDGNNISTVHGNHGNFSDYDVTGNSGTEWPKGSNKTVIFQGGVWLLSGKTRMAGTDVWVDELRSAAGEYTSEFVPGTLDETINDGHLYEINRAEIQAFLENDYAVYSSMSAMLPLTVVDGSAVFTELVDKSFPTDDFLNWPVEAGAPWVDADGDGVYNIENGDHPDILGDQFHWYVMNDGDAGQHTPLWGTPPMNVEIQTSLFGFNQSGPLGDIAFVRWVIINKGADDLDSAFVSIWHDDDVGDANDDLVGCDTLLSVGYTYNSGPDVTYGTEAPCTASDFFQGPLVDSPGDTAQILTWSLDRGYYLRDLPNKERLSLTSFVPYINGDPALADPETAEEAYRYMNGRIGVSGEVFVNPQSGQATNFVYPGDPVAGTGWTDDIEPKDRRYLMSSGPFYLGSGDTIEVVGSIIVAAGSNWAKSITKMKYFDNFAQGAFDALFNVCSPPAPKVELSLLDEEVVLSFEDDFEKVEDYACTGYSFEGYNVYQGESVTGPWHRIATYDIVNDIKLILDLTLDEATGELLEFPAQFGTDSDIPHYIDITYDYVNERPLINYREYYYSVTSYAFDEAAAQRVIESPIQVIRAVPGVTGVGSDLASLHANVLPAVHTTGSAAASVMPIVIDPYQLNNLDYTLSVESIGDTASKWILSQGGVSLMDSTEFPVTREHFEILKAANSGVDYPGVYISNTITDGFILSFEQGGWDIPGVDTSYVSDDPVDSTEFVFQGQGGTWAKFVDDLHTAVPAIVPGVDGFPGLGELQNDIEIRFVENGSIATWICPNTLRNYLVPSDTIVVPFELWDVENDRRLNIAVYQVAGSVEPASFITLVDSAGTTYEFSLNFQVIPIYSEYDGVLRDFANDASTFGWVLNFDPSSTFFEYGTVLHVNFANPLIAGVDSYDFTASGLEASSDIKSQLDAINVFPNPYFGQNPEETTPNNRTVSFTHLGIGTSTIRIFTISGDLVTKIEHVVTSENDANNRANWDLRNLNGVPVASGMYIAHITVEGADGGKIGERILKLAVFQPEERLDLF
ncbi:MAG: T9SS type A sorting domain-containing protein [Candidatus Marinimicrobia bacterium]|nr:T9SS type A sorting domain-containing protein [Candidatus Neomarinimicrobiota bacterium]